MWTCFVAYTMLYALCETQRYGSMMGTISLEHAATARHDAF